jgi:hypothetical protein
VRLAVDSNDRDRIEYASKELNKMLFEEELREAVLQEDVGNGNFWKRQILVETYQSLRLLNKDLNIL